MAFDKWQHSLLCQCMTSSVWHCMWLQLSSSLPAGTILHFRSTRRTEVSLARTKSLKLPFRYWKNSIVGILLFLGPLTTKSEVKRPDLVKLQYFFEWTFFNTGKAHMGISECAPLQSASQKDTKLRSLCWRCKACRPCAGIWRSFCLLLILATLGNAGSWMNGVIRHLAVAGVGWTHSHSVFCFRSRKKNKAYILDFSFCHF